MHIRFESTLYLDCHLSGEKLVVGVRTKCRSERKLRAINVLLTIECDESRSEINDDMDLRIRFTTPFDGFLMRHGRLRPENQEQPWCRFGQL
ncbi:unnamed protein product [Arabis nemorensis]|uniref:Uncharacterized protein n=1 Tax=Arabis nemorensis TaxID=586526 RepID=A0A565CQC6_9BRAS|nr:unnamed protein product [Arabis nemorensis]